MALMLGLMLLWGVFAGGVFLLVKGIQTLKNHPGAALKAGEFLWKVIKK